MTDETRMYAKIDREFAEHGTTLHGKGIVGKRLT